MPTIPSQMQADLDAGTTTHCDCWYMLMQDGAELGFTNHDVDIVYTDGDISPNEITYQAGTGWSSTAITRSGGLNVDNSDVDGFFGTGGLSANDAATGRYDKARMKMFRIDWRDTTKGIIKISDGFLGEMKRSDELFSYELRSIAQALTQNQGERYISTCTAELGDTRCAKSLTNFTWTAQTLTSVTSSSLMACTAITELDGMFDYGKITMTSGASIGISKDVKSWTQTGGVIELFETFPLGVSSGDEFTMVAGCNKLRLTCIEKFGNINNYRGFPYVPGPTLCRKQSRYQPMMSCWLKKSRQHQHKHRSHRHDRADSVKIRRR
jgi:uncharacterized phage protein (TIGR02218 family)